MTMLCVFSARAVAVSAQNTKIPIPVVILIRLNSCYFPSEFTRLAQSSISSFNLFSPFNSFNFGCGLPGRCHSWLSLFGSLRASCLRRFKIILVGDVRNTDDQHPHAAARAMNHSRRDVDNGPSGNLVLDAIEADSASSIEDVVKLGGALMKVQARSVYVHRMRPGCGRDLRVFAADEPVPPPAGAAFALGIAFVTDQHGTGN